MTPALDTAARIATRPAVSASPSPQAPSTVSPSESAAAIDAEGTAPAAQRKAVGRRLSHGETAAEQDARVAREKAEFAVAERERKAAEAVYHGTLAEQGKLAAQVGLPGLAAWQQQQQQVRTEMHHEADRSEYEAKMATTSTELSRALSEISQGSGSWDQRRAILGRARVNVASHLAELASLKSTYHDKLASFAGEDTRALTEIEQRAAEVDKRRDFLDSYYRVLERLAGNDDSAVTDLKQLGVNQPEIDEEMVRSSSKMRVAARRRRQVWEGAG